MPTRAIRISLGNAKRKRESAHRRGYTRQWRNESKRWLSNHPFCAECQRHGRFKAARVVDHIKPHRGDQKLFWDMNNWQSMCKKCHDVKTLKGL